MIADQAVREEALDASRSFIVQAPAGSGKTGLLVQRYLRLLGLVRRPESVVAMTFTRKAAAEMKDRIYEALLAASRGETAVSDYDRRTRELAAGVLSQDERYGWNLLLDPSQLQVQTIDSLCALLARQMPVISGFGGVAQVVENATELYRMAARNTLRDLAEGTNEKVQLLARLGVYFDGDFVCLENQIVRMLAQREQWREPAGECEPEVQDFCALLSDAETALARVFKAHNTVDFTAITEAAIRVLGAPEQPSDLLYGLDYRIQHLLVDEFQDTSLAQYKLINAMTAQWSDDDGHTLFLVGDPMQSIYGFRGAEVSLFLRSWNERRLESVRLFPLALETNFRSRPEILEWVKDNFESVMSSDASGGLSFRSSQASREPGGRPPELTALVDDEAGLAEAGIVTKLAKSAKKRGSVAILVRNRNHLLSILPALRDAGILYEAIEIDKLAEQQHVDDVISLTRAVLHVGDRLAWLACLRAPWCGLTLADLAALAENERERPICDLLSDPEKMAALSMEGRFDAARAGEILLAAAHRAGRLPLRTLIEDAWLLLGGPAILREPHQREDVESYLALIDGLEQGGTIRDPASLAERLDLLFAQPASGQNHVQVMTIHKAKGLEFDTVILPKLGGGSRPNERELLLWNEEIGPDGTPRLEVAAQPRRGEKDGKYDAVDKARKDRETEELKRLFYVGCTRAKNELYLIGSAKSKKDGAAVQRPGGSFLGQIWTRVEKEFEGVLRRSPVQQSLFVDAVSKRETILRRLPADWRNPRFAPAVRWKPAFTEITASARKVTYEWVSDTGRHVGTVVHEMLRRAAEDSWTAAKASSMTPMVRSELLRLGVSQAEVAAAVQRVMSSVANTLANERGRWILADHPEARCEWLLGGRIGDQVISGTVDRVLRDSDDRLWIIDYKVSDHEGAGVAQFLDAEQRRYRSQLDNYAGLIEQSFAGPIWLGLYFPLLDGWREWQYEAAALIAH